MEMEVRDLRKKSLDELIALAEQLELKNHKHSGRDDFLRSPESGISVILAPHQVRDKLQPGTQ